MNKLRKGLSPAEPHPVFDILKQGIIHWMDAVVDTAFDPSISEYPQKFHESLRKAIDEQALIGWHNVL